MMWQKQLLIVENDGRNRRMLYEILSGEYTILDAKNGQEAMGVLKQNKDSIALILLNLESPIRNGYTFLDQIKQDPSLSPIPVIVMTESGSEADEVAALAHGATDFVPKPYRPQVILHRVASIIKLRETAAMINQFQYDRLTGLFSKEFFYQKARERLSQHPELEYIMICANVENFKLFNDVFGVPAGDRLLKEIADAFQTMVEDTGICGRYRADRFISLQERTQQYESRIAHGADGYFRCIAPEKNIVMRWGIYEITDRSLPVEQMCDRALLAADSIKGQYNKPFAIYDAALRDKLLREQAITSSMESALSEGQFVVYLQPKYDLKDHCIAGTEALVRWIHPQWGIISPGEFIPLFEKNGFIPQLDQYVWKRACAILRGWKNTGCPLLPISVNVSRADVFHPNLVDTLWGLTKTYGIDPKYLHLELTESAYSEHPNKIISTVKELRGLGFVVEMDDFGSGYSSLNMLSQMELDVLKLDMRFVQFELTKPPERSILNDIITMAHRLNLRVVAEGVETQEQIDRLQAMGCDYAQGYFFSKPTPATEFEALSKDVRDDSAQTVAAIRSHPADTGDILPS